MIPKPNSSKLRQLGIPTAMDRVVQASLVLVLEPIFEADFKPVSYGFGPRRRAKDAIALLRDYFRLVLSSAMSWSGQLPVACR